MAIFVDTAQNRRFLSVNIGTGCGFSAQILGPNSVQRDFDGTPMITDTMAVEDLLALAGVMREKGRGFIQLTAPPKIAEKVAEASGRPVVWNALVNDL